ncbi:hypothetical protein [Streptacidiphilus sp. PAMC 29251]
MTADRPRPLRVRLRALVDQHDFDAAHALLDSALAAPRTVAPQTTAPQTVEAQKADPGTGADEDRFMLLIARAGLLARQRERPRARAALAAALAEAAPVDARAEAAAAGVLLLLGDARQAELAARCAVDLDPADWRGHAALAEVVAARNLASEAVTHARRAVACAPGEPRTHLALAFALRSMTPSKKRYAEEATAELDRALELGADPIELKRPRRDGRIWPGCLAVVVVLLAVKVLGTGDAAGTPGRIVVFALLGLALVVLQALAIRRRGKGVREYAAASRELTRRRFATAEQLHGGAPLGAAAVALLSMPAMFLTAARADGQTPASWWAWLQLAAVPVVVAVGTLGIDYWIGRGTTRRTLAADGWSTASLAATAVLAGLPAVLVLRHAGSDLLWNLLAPAGFGWIVVGGFLGVIASGRRRKRLTRPAGA